MPKLWTDSIASHRPTVREATLDAAAAVVAERGLTGVTMSALADRTGIGRATLYKYFPDIQAVLAAWHERQVNRHLEALATLPADGDPLARLRILLERYARLAALRHANADAAIARSLHREEHVGEAHQKLHQLVAQAIAAAEAEGLVRNDVPPIDLASFALNALSVQAGGAGTVATTTLVTLVIDGIMRR